MELGDFLQMPAEKITDIDRSDIVRESSLFFDISKKIEQVKTTDDLANFLAVYLDSKDEIKALVTYKNITDLLQHLINNHGVETDSKVLDAALDKGSEYKPKIDFKLNEPISVIADYFTNNDENVVIVKDENNKFVGKILRKNFIKKIREMSGGNSVLS